MFSLRKLVEKRRRGNDTYMALAFVDLQKALDNVPRKNGNGYSEMDGSTRIRSENG